MNKKRFESTINKLVALPVENINQIELFSIKTNP